MEELQTKKIDVAVNGKTISCQIKERDFGDMIVFDILSKNDYLFTLTQNGDVLFNEGENNQKNVMDPRDLNEIIEAIKGKLESDPM